MVHLILHATCSFIEGLAAPDSAGDITRFGVSSQTAEVPGCGRDSAWLLGLGRRETKDKAPFLPQEARNGQKIVQSESRSHCLLHYYCLLICNLYATLFLQAKEHCNLEHILSLWQTLSVGLARTITLSGQV